MKHKRFLAALLGALLILTLAPSAFAAEADGASPEGAAEDAADTAAEETADAADFVTRGEFLEALCNLSGAAAVGAQDAFADVPAEGGIAGIVRWAVGHKIVNGYGNGTFGPDDPVTREQAAAMIYRYAQSVGKGFSGMWMFLLDAPDAAEISEYADEAMHWAVMNGLFTAAEEGLRPKAALVRGEMIPLLSRALSPLGIEKVWLRFADIALSVEIPGDVIARQLSEEDHLTQYLGRSGDLLVCCMRWDRVCEPDIDAMKAFVPACTGEETAFIEKNGVRIVKVLHPNGDLHYVAFSYDGDLYSLWITVSDPEAVGRTNEEVKDALDAAEASICHFLDIPDGAPSIIVEMRKQNPDYLVLVNKQNALPAGWEDALDTVRTTNSLGDSVSVEREAYKAYLALRADLEGDGVKIDLDSAYRSVGEQREIMDRFTEEYGADYAKKTVAEPGYSEHHTGLALDLYLNIDGEDVYYNEDMIRYPGVWAKIHAKLADHGFILRYPEDMEHVTGYGYEPWHIRYVGSADTARRIEASGLTLEGWLGAADETKVAVDYGTSSRFTAEELKEAAVQVKCNFAFWKGCALHSLRYAGDESCSEENVKWANEINPDGRYTEVIAFIGNFRSPVEAYGAWEANLEYENYQWWLGRSADSGWDLFSTGY